MGGIAACGFPLFSLWKITLGKVVPAFPSGLELSQIVLRFDSELPDTSSAEDEIQKNVFRLRTNDDTVCEEQLPAIPANSPYYIYPKRGLPELCYSLEVAPMYACNCGGSVDLIFTKVS